MTKIAVSTSRISAYIDQRLEGLVGCLEEDDAPPTREARSACHRILKNVEAIWDDLMPLPTVTTAGDGDIFCQWVKDDNIAFVDIESTGAIRLFYKKLSDNGTEIERTVYAPSATEIRDALRGLVA